jgi:hypothetical protein
VTDHYPNPCIFSNPKSSMLLPSTFPILILFLVTLSGGGPAYALANPRIVPKVVEVDTIARGRRRSVRGKGGLRADLCLGGGAGGGAGDGAGTRRRRLDTTSAFSAIARSRVKKSQAYGLFIILPKRDMLVSTTFLRKYTCAGRGADAFLAHRVVVTE